MITTGCIHGRFQIFHNDHLLYLLESFQQVEKLIIGITSVNGLRGESPPGHRLSPESNPFTYFERVEMIRDTIRAHPKLDPSRISFSPFPIEQPEMLSEFIPTSFTCFTTIREDWNTQKIESLKNLGYPVSVLPRDSAKLISGTQIRSLIRSGNCSWKNFVPQAVAHHLESNKLLDRIKDPALAKRSPRQLPPSL